MNALSRRHIKICGMTRLEDAKLAMELGAWAIGFIFSKASPRAITPGNAGQIIRSLAAPQLKTVGVFVNATVDEIAVAAAQSRISAAQLHGDETPEFCAALHARLPGLGMFKALRPKDAGDLVQLPSYAAICEAVLLDTYVEGQPGGTGVTGDWKLVAEGAKLYKVILAGGLNPENIQAALDTRGIFGVDASSGLEGSPGLKSREKMKLFFKNAGFEA